MEKGNVQELKLLRKIKIDTLTLQNCMAMAPMTRSRADLNGINSDLSALYYAQRAGAGLLITEGINISSQALGSPFTPGIYTQEQIDGWKKETK